MSLGVCYWFILVWFILWPCCRRRLWRAWQQITKKSTLKSESKCCIEVQYYMLCLACKHQADLWAKVCWPVLSNATRQSKKARKQGKLTQTDPNWQPANRHGFTESWVHLYSKSWRTRRVFPEGKSTKYLQAASKSTNEATSCSPATVLVWQVQQATGWAPRDRPQAAVVEWWHKRPKQLVGPLLDLPQGQDCARKQLEISFQVVAGNTNASWAATLCRSCTNIRATAMGS